jgi:hypothetical protein
MRACVRMRVDDWQSAAEWLSSVVSVLGSLALALVVMLSAPPSSHALGVPWATETPTATASMEMKVRSRGRGGREWQWL